MEIKSINVYDSANRWSSYRKKLVEMKLDIGELEEQPTNKIRGFAERLESLLPSMYEHECSEMRPGGFFERVRGGTWIGHVIEHIALELQSLAGMECGFGRTRSAGAYGLYYVVFTYEVKEAGVYAAKAAVKLAEALVKNVSYDIDRDIAVLKQLAEQNTVMAERER